MDILDLLIKKVTCLLSLIGDGIELCIRTLIVAITDLLPVKIIRDDRGVPFLYRYHLITFGYDGPGLCIHRFVKSDPERGYHDHPWSKAISFILCGGYTERILVKDNSNNDNEMITENDEQKTELNYQIYQRKRWTFNYLDGVETFHRVLIDEGKDAWTLFAFNGRSKI